MGVEFEEEKDAVSGTFLSRSIIGVPTRPKMISLVMKTGLVKTDKGGGYFLVAIIILSIIASVMIFFYFVLGMTPTSFWNSVSGKSVKYNYGVPPIVLKNLTPEMKARVELINRQR